MNQMPAGEEFIIDVNGLEIAALKWGEAGGEVILALHGWLDNAASFVPLAPFLSKYQLIAIDLPGHGRSAHKSPDARYHFMDAVADVIDIVDTMACQKLTLLGHSLGGAIATIVGGILSTEISSILLVDALGPFSNEAEEAANQSKKAVKQLRHFRSINKKRVLYPTFEQAVMARKKSGISETSVRLLAERGVIESPNGFYWQYDPRLKLPSLMRLTENQVQSYLNNIVAPLYLIRPTSGLDLEKSFMESRVKKVPSIRVAEIEGHHHVHMDDAAQVGKLLQTFLSA